MAGLSGVPPRGVGVTYRLPHPGRRQFLSLLARRWPLEVFRVKPSSGTLAFIYQSTRRPQLEEQPKAVAALVYTRKETWASIPVQDHRGRNRPRRISTIQSHPTIASRPNSCRQPLDQLTIDNKPPHRHHPFRLASNVSEQSNPSLPTRPSIRT